jgi:hypothetical protein
MTLGGFVQLPIELETRRGQRWQYCTGAVACEIDSKAN